MTESSHIRYQDIPETTADLDWADLIAIDLSEFDQPGGKQKLASQLKEAISTVGFFYVKNFGLSEAEVDQQFSLAQSIFALPASEKQKYLVDPNKQGFFGYKPAGTRKQQHGLGDSVEIYDDPKWNSIYKAEHPRPAPLAASEAAAASEAFQLHLHNHVLRRLLILSAIIMELPDEESLWNLHNYPSRSQCHLRYMLYHPRSPHDLQVMREHGIDNVYGHTDFGTFTLLMRQPIAGLQVRPAGAEKWKWVKPLRGSITVNVADTLSFLTGGFLESSIHRVVLPPEDQQHLPRYGVIYFARPDDDTLLKPLASPLLEREKKTAAVGSAERVLPPGGVTAGEWVKLKFSGISANYANNKENRVVVKSVEVASYA